LEPQGGAPKPPIGVVQIVGYKKSGKTTLACRLIERFAADGWAVGALKHDAHDFEPDVAGTDSHRLRLAGARAAAIASPRRTAWFEERGAELGELLSRMRAQGLDLVVVEGWKREPYPKLALVQKEEDVPLLAELAGVLAVVTWNAELRERLQRPAATQRTGETRMKTAPPVLAFDDIEGIASCVRCGIGAFSEKK